MPQDIKGEVAIVYATCYCYLATAFAKILGVWACIIPNSSHYSST